MCVVREATLKRFGWLVVVRIWSALDCCGNEMTAIVKQAIFYIPQDRTLSRVIVAEGKCTVSRKGATINISSICDILTVLMMTMLMSI